MAGKIIPQAFPKEFPIWWQLKFWEENYKWNLQTGCLEWQGKVNRFGYARVGYGNLIFFAHRVAFFLYYGIDPGDLLVRHRCHNRLCGCPTHLRLGTHEDNSRDMVESGRSQLGAKHWTQRRPERVKELKAKGVYAPQATALAKLNEHHPNTILTADKVREIKERLAQGADNRTLAAEYGVTHSNISAIANGKSWKHIEVEIPERIHDHSYAQKLTEDQVREIRRRGDAGESGESLAREFKIGATAVFKIRHRITWKHIE
jgi:hypothetical protein